jgi:starch phosphorylase
MTPPTSRAGLKADDLRRSFDAHLHYSRGRSPQDATARDRYDALALSVRDRLVDRGIATERAIVEQDAKTVHYLSAEFLLGRLLRANLQALGIEHAFRSVLADMSIDLDELVEQEPEPGLGNGGLGRLAACFLESLASLGFPARGYGIRYEFGIFEQVIRDGQQVERADEWLRFGNPWEMARPEGAVAVGFGGDTQNVAAKDGFRVLWHPADQVLGVPHDLPVAGFRNGVVLPLRLWAAKSSREFDLSLFNAGDYVRAVEEKNASEVISKVLYPNDNFAAGRELRLRQEYFFVACSIHDIVRRHLVRHPDLSNFSHKNAIQLNDTHPAIAVAELMRVLIDEHGLDWQPAWTTTVASLGFTNHTLMPEALERWPVALLQRMLPRQFEIIREIDRRFVRHVLTTYPQQPQRAEQMAIIDQADPPQIHMARLAVVGSHAVNGVAALHTELLRGKVMKPFAELYPGRFQNKTNGVTPRRWLLACNPPLAGLVSERIGDGWITDLEQLRNIEPCLDDSAFLDQLMAIKHHHKQQLTALIASELDLRVDPHAIFDVQIKRLHEYKRQLLNLLHIVALYLRAKRGEQITARVFVFAAKAAPGYRQAKLIIRLIHAVADVINRDPDVDAIRIAFLPNYRVTLAEQIIVAADVSEQISTAGTEASGTGNMKLALNGALSIGTLDGANIEIRDAVGAENFFLFGMCVEEVEARRASQPAGRGDYDRSEVLREVLDLIADGFFSRDEPTRFRRLVNQLLDHDHYMVLGDFDAYCTCQTRLADAYQERESWTRMVGLNIARVGRFSSDRSIREYANDIWNIQPLSGLDGHTF